jgi:hypothetical protein
MQRDTGAVRRSYPELIDENGRAAGHSAGGVAPFPDAYLGGNGVGSLIRVFTVVDGGAMAR